MICATDIILKYTLLQAFHTLSNNLFANGMILKFTLLEAFYDPQLKAE